MLYASQFARVVDIGSIVCVGSLTNTAIGGLGQLFANLAHPYISSLSRSNSEQQKHDVRFLVRHAGMLLLIRERAEKQSDNCTFNLPPFAENIKKVAFSCAVVKKCSMMTTTEAFE